MESKSNKRNSTNRSLSKKELLFILFFSFVFVFFFFVFKQIDIIMNNQTEFNILFKEIIASYILITLMILVLCIATLLILCYYCKNVYKYVVVIFTGILIASYIQFLFLNSFVTFNVNGHVNASIFQFVLNAIIWLAIALFPLFIFVRYQKKHKQDTNQDAIADETKKTAPNLNSFTKAVVCILSVIFGMQAIGMLTTVGGYETPAANNELYYFSIDEQLKLSRNENIIVFVIDRMDTDYIDEIFEKYPQDKEIFSGFTYYTDNISQYPGTFPSITSLLTGEVFNEKQTQVEFMQKAWEDPLLFEALKENNYEINGLLNSIATFYDFEDVKDKFDNIKQLDKKNRVVKKFRFYNSVLSAAMNQFMPYALKEAFVGYINIPNDCIEIRNTPDYFTKTCCPESDLAFYNRLTDEQVGLTANEEKNVFSFVHLLGSHNPYNYNYNLKYTTKTNEISQTRGTYKILKEYFTQMKNLGIFEDATIIVTADHGNWNTIDNLKGINEPPMAGLFIKEAGEGSNDANDVTDILEVDENSQTSSSNFIPSIIEILKENNNNSINQAFYDEVKAEGHSYSDVTKPVSEGGLGGIQERYYYYVRWTNMNSTYYMGEYVIRGSAKDADNWAKAE